MRRVMRNEPAELPVLRVRPRLHSAGLNRQRRHKTQSHHAPFQVPTHSSSSSAQSIDGRIVILIRDSC